MRGLLTIPWFWICCLFNALYFFLSFSWKLVWWDRWRERTYQMEEQSLKAEQRWRNKTWKQNQDPYHHPKKNYFKKQVKKKKIVTLDPSKMPRGISLGLSTSEASVCFLSSPPGQHGVWTSQLVGASQLRWWYDKAMDRTDCQNYCHKEILCLLGKQGLKIRGVWLSIQLQEALPQSVACWYSCSWTPTPRRRGVCTHKHVCTSLFCSVYFDLQHQSRTHFWLQDLCQSWYIFITHQGFSLDKGAVSPLLSFLLSLLSIMSF